MRNIAICLVLVGALASAPVRAADDAVCQEFTFTMLAYVKTNALRRCTGMGPQWSPRPAEHLSWCQKATDAAIKERLAQSKKFIDTCLKTGIGSTSEAPASSPPAATAAAPAVAPAKPAPVALRDGGAEASLPARTFP